MKKAIYLVVILTLSVFTTACINNLAVQELNNKAAEYMKEGDYENAISRLKSSVDLDGNIFETQYNLAVAYTENGDYEEAMEAFEKASALNPNSKELSYSKAVMFENYARDLFTGNTKAQKEALEDDEEQSVDEEFKPSEIEIEDVKKYYAAAVENYSKYLESNVPTDEASEIRDRIKDIEEKLEVLDSEVATN